MGLKRHFRFVLLWLLVKREGAKLVAHGAWLDWTGMGWGKASDNRKAHIEPTELAHYWRLMEMGVCIISVYYFGGDVGV